ncbi:hypothetical protein [Aurantimonas sp. Leaf443]|uniref:hypothetical protein n=1 Tax=Aurantimonas sp. Leaf443 TaxID=1736378 RepID=UPI0012E3B8D4|nr:hypothetical protein [Aurantimonas sp. Leaf443]
MNEPNGQKALDDRGGIGLTAGLAPLVPLAAFAVLVWLAPPAQAFFALNAAFLWAGAMLAYLAGRAPFCLPGQRGNALAIVLMGLAFAVLIAAIWAYPRLSLGLSAAGFLLAFAARARAGAARRVLAAPGLALALVSLAAVAVAVISDPGL